MPEVDRGRADSVRRGRKVCTRCGSPHEIQTVPFRGRYLSLCNLCRDDLGVAHD